MFPLWSHKCYDLFPKQYMVNHIHCLLGMALIDGLPHLAYEIPLPLASGGDKEPLLGYFHDIVSHRSNQGNAINSQRIRHRS